MAEETKLSAKKERSDTTLSVSKAFKSRLVRKAKELGISPSVYAESAASYFMRYGLNPINESSEKDLLLEVHKLREDLFRFLRKQEYEEIAPTLQQVQRLNENMIRHNNSLVSLVETVGGLPVDLYKIHLLQNATLTALYQLNSIETDKEVQQIAQQVGAGYEKALAAFNQQKGG